MQCQATQVLNPKTLITDYSNRQLGGHSMKFWLLHSACMLMAVAYAACVACPKAAHSFNSTGPVEGHVQVVEADRTATAIDYGLGLGEAEQTASAESGTPGTESAKVAEKEPATPVSNDAPKATNGAGVAKSENAAQPKDYLIYFTATWCGPCRSQKPVIESIKDAGKHKVFIVDIDQDRASANAWGISSVPVVAVVRDGKVVYRGNGAGHSREFLESKLEGK